MRYVTPLEPCVVWPSENTWSWVRNVAPSGPRVWVWSPKNDGEVVLPVPPVVDGARPFPEQVVVGTEDTRLGDGTLV